MNSPVLELYLASSSGYYVPPPVSSTVVTDESLNLNDEIFFNQNSTMVHYDEENYHHNHHHSIHHEHAESALSLSLTLLLNLNSHDFHSTSTTTPDFPSPTKQPSFINSYAQNYGYARPPARHQHTQSFSLPIDQLNLLTLKTLTSSASSNSSSPEMFPNDDTATLSPQHEYPGLQKERESDYATINPRQLFHDDSERKFKHLEPPLTSPASVAVPSATNPKSYILPSSVSSPSLASLFNQRPKNKSHASASDISYEQKQMEYVMNDECYNAISYWLNNTAQVLKNDGRLNFEFDFNKDFGYDYDKSAEILTNPTGVVKLPLSKRRNSIQTVSQFARQPVPVVEAKESLDSAGQKKKRRKSYNYEVVPGASAMRHELQHSAADDDGAVSPGSAHRSPRTTPTLRPSAKFELPHPISEEPSSFHHDEPEPETNIKIDTTQQYDEDGQPKPFPCPNCTKVFKRSEHLKRHIRSVHSNIRPFHCKYCDKKFSRSDNLAQHLKTHYKTDDHGNSTIIYGNPNAHGRGGGRRALRSAK